MVDHWWQTETGWPIVANPVGLGMLPVKLGSPSVPMPGYDVHVVDDAAKPLAVGTMGSIVIKLPLPPGCLPTLYRQDERMRESYLSEFPGYYKTADAGFIDEDGYLTILGRTDDIINVAGHRLSTGGMEEVVASHPDVAECAVLGVKDEVKGEAPCGFVVLKAGVNRPTHEIETEVVQLVRDKIGPVAAFKMAFVVPRLPKTRSGKILRGTMKKIADHDPVGRPRRRSRIRRRWTRSEQALAARARLAAPSDERAPRLARRRTALYMSRDRHDRAALRPVTRGSPTSKWTAMTSSPSTAPHVANFTLSNGLDVVVIPDHRAPVVTHMVWYRNGAADDPPGKSGIAHFLEHLMFKGTKRHPKGEFSEFISEVGGMENAFTGNDFTAYFQQIAKQHLKACMAFEADRMTGLTLTDDIVAPERDVVLEERRMHCDSDPGAQLGEAVQAALFTHHPYGIPVIGWGHEIEGLNREDALAYYRRFYTPENAILVVAGDVEPDEARALAEETYGKIKPRGAKPERVRPMEPPTVANRLVTVADDKVEQPGWQRHYLAPSARTAPEGEAEALELLAHLFGGGQTSFLYRTLVIEERIAVSAWSYYHGAAVDQSRFIVNMTPAPGVSLEMLDKAFDRALTRFVQDGIEAGDLERAKTRMVADAIYARDSQSDLARWYGSSLAIGQTLRDVEEWPARIERVSAEDVTEAARRWLDHKPAVTGLPHASRRGGGLSALGLPAPIGAKKTNPTETLTGNAHAKAPRRFILPFRRQCRRRRQPARLEILARPVSRGAGRFARIRHARRRGAGPGGKGGPGRADGGPSSTRARANWIRRPFTALWTRKRSKCRSIATAIIGAGACAR